MTMLKKSAMKSQLGSCVYMMKGAYDFSLMRALSKSDNIQLGKCGSHEKLRNATVNEYIQTPEYKKLFDMLDNVKSALTTLTDVDIASMSPLLSVELLYSKAADPSYIWLSGDSLFPLAINNSTGDFKEHELILDIVYRPTDAIFETTENSTTPLSESIHFVSYQDDDIRTNNDAVLNADPTKQRFEVKDDRHEPVSTFLYSNLNKNSDSHATVLYHKNTDCPNGKCTFYWRGHKASNSSAGMICGGITLVMKHADGYVVLDGDKIGTREVSSSNNR